MNQPWETIVRASRGQNPAPTEAEQLIAQLDTEVLDNGLAKPWHPQPGETAQEYFAFSIFRDQGANRPNPTSRIAREKMWVQRTKAYDEWLDTQPQTEQATAQAIAKSLLGTMQVVGHLIQLELFKMAQQIATSQHSSISLPELARIVESFAKTSRLLTNQTTENLGVGRWDLSKFSADELAELEEYTKKALPA